MGARLIFQGSDIMTMKSNFIKMQTEAKELGFTFEGSINPN